jgi:pimeloyl-ACP methyl ester carboxylesterase
MAACSSSSNGSSSGSSSGGSEASTDAPTVTGIVPEIACTDSIDSVYADPGDVSSQAKGAILKCAHDRDLTAAELLAAAQSQVDGGNPPYSGKAFTSGAHIYRVLYRTERGDTNGSPGYSSALLLLPDTPRNGGKQLPVVVAAHGSRGQGADCAPSQNMDPAPQSATNGQYVQEDFFHLVYPLVGLGYPVIATDYAGYANFGGANNPPPTYDSASDLGKSVLDGARALRKAIPSSVSQQAVLVGHSEGGYASLAALSMAQSYGLDGVISGVAVYAPLWISKRVYGVILSLPSNFPFSSSNVGPVSLWYHYTHSALLDGPDAGYELVQPSKVSDLQPFVTKDCWAASYPDLTKNGEKTANDYMDPAYVTAMTSAVGIFGSGSCGDGGAAQECQTWVDRMTADWPHLDGGAASVPVLIWYAVGDTTIAADDMQCALNRLAIDGVNAKYCYDSNPNLAASSHGHGGSVADNSAYVADWIAQQTLPDAGAPTEPCQALPTNDAGAAQLLGPDGGPIACYEFIPTQ